MILAEETTKYLGDNEGVLNVQLMMKRGYFAPSPNTTKSHVTTTSANGNKREHTTKAPRDQLPTAPPAMQ